MPDRRTVRYLGVDTGGTFTDLVEIDGAGRLTFEKAFSTPKAPEQGILDALAGLPASAGLDIRELLERDRTLRARHHGLDQCADPAPRRARRADRHARLRGHADHRPRSGRTRRRPAAIEGDGFPAHRAAAAAGAEGLHPRRERADRCGRRGARTAQRGGGARGDRSRFSPWASKASRCVSCGRSAIQRTNGACARSRAQVAPGLPVSLSCEIAPRMGEFERMVTTAVNAFIGPVTERYIRGLQQRLSELGLARPIQVMKSSGSVMLPDAGRPPGGVGGQFRADRRAGGGAPCRQASRLRQDHHRRHGRHQLRRRPDRRRRVRGREHAVPRPGPAGARADHQGGDDRRRRRLDRVDRRLSPAGRAAERRRRPRPRLLRPRRQRADGRRRAGRPRHHRSGEFLRRPLCARRGEGARGDRRSHRGPARARSARSGGGHLRGRDRQDGRSHPQGDGRERPRSARVLLVVLWRRRRRALRGLRSASSASSASSCPTPRRCSRRSAWRCRILRIGTCAPRRCCSTRRRRPRPSTTCSRTFQNAHAPTCRRAGSIRRPPKCTTASRCVTSGR